MYSKSTYNINFCKSKDEQSIILFPLVSDSIWITFIVNLHVAIPVTVALQLHMHTLHRIRVPGTYSYTRGIFIHIQTCITGQSITSMPFV